MIHLHRLILKDGDPESIRDCCLSAPPDDPSSVLLLTRTNKPTLVFFHLEGKRKKLRWIEMSYAAQLKRLTGEEGDFLHKLTCCNGKVFALNGNCDFACFVVQLDILAEAKEVIIKLSLFRLFPTPSWENCDEMKYFLKGYYTELFIITVGYHHKTVQAAHLIRLNMNNVTLEDMERFKGLDMSSKRWIDQDLDDTNISMELWDQFFDLEDAIFCVDLVRESMTYYRPGIASELGGYIHIRDRVDDRVDNILYSYHVKEKTMSLSYMPSLVLSTSNVSLWECRLEDDHGGAKCTVDSKQEKSQIVVRSVTDKEIGLHWNLLNLPFDILEMIIRHCVAVEYLNFRVTCKGCKVAAPLIQWGNKTSLTRLETYSLVSPWLMVVDEIQGIITFTDPVSGDNYFMNNQCIFPDNEEIYCSRFGWLFFFSSDIKCFVFYNPFTRHQLALPDANYVFNAACFSAPPTSPDCIVAGFSIGDECRVLIYHEARDSSSWRAIRVGAGPVSIQFLTFFGQDLYALDGDGKLIVFRELGKENYCTTRVETETTISCCISPTRHYLMKWDQHLLKVIVGKFGERVEVFKLDVSKGNWEKIDSLGNHMIYLCGSTCLCIEAKKREMENKIYFPILHSKNKKIVHYSLETCTFQTLSGENIEEHLNDFFGTTHHFLPHVWIEPSWS